MASPAASTASGDVAGAQKKLEQITFRFCTECSNMLYPKEDEDSHRLQFVCRTCNFTDKATSSCIFRNVLNNAAGETAGVTQDVGSDPTVGAHDFSPPSCCPAPVIVCLFCGIPVVCEMCETEFASEERLVAASPTTSQTTAPKPKRESIESVDSLDHLLEYLDPMLAMDTDEDNMFEEDDAEGISA